ncbi:hypothetical protein K3163_08260 [Qipengyuania sp. 1NDW9]|uniref:hypothetical protein n=1 Tax=Qipengyuania xiapuensis TaxID=2867236 RepID=UPI001C8785F5|nr:hypothetical protein [Qipengyuania xiapuensis]MBX7493200.1 hypothetical protein [Qipengyuania xiapuensis]
MMKNLMILAACGALAACGSNEAEAPEPIETDVAVTDTATAEQVAGTYEVTMEDGTVVRQQVNADGTYVDTDLEGNVTESGSWRQAGDQLCYDPDGADGETCWTGGAPGPDGTFEATTADGSVTTTVRRIEG